MHGTAPVSARWARRTLLAYACVAAVPFAALTTAALFTPMALHAQAAGTASLQGSVKDSTGAAIPNATVVYTNTETGAKRETRSSGSGDYSIPNVPVGKYSIKVTAAGFTGFEQRGVLEVGNSATVDAALSIGSESQVVEVQAGAVALETETVNYKQVVDQTRINELPLNGRQATQLVLVTGGAVTAPGNDMTGSKNYASSTTIAVAGGQGNYNNYVLDGGYHTDNFTNVNLPYPFPDALREFSVESNSLPARNGIHPGALVNAVTVSGTNSWHGSVFEFIRNNVINATNFFSVNTTTGAPIRDTIKRNQFGGTLGGHIVRDKLFFFGGYQGTRERAVGNATTYCLPTAAELAGDFSQMGGACGKNAADGSNLVNPATGAQISTTPGTANYRRVNTASYSQQALNFVKYLPLAQADQFGLVSVALPANNQEDQYIGRVDWNISQRHTLFTRYFLTNYKAPSYYSPTNILLTTTAGNDERVQTATVGDVFNISPSMVNTFNATWARRRDNRGPTAGGINAQTLGVNVYTYVPVDLRLSVTNGPSAGCGTCSPGFFNTNSEDFTDAIDYQRGKHAFAFGFEYIRAADNTNAGYLQNGQYTFNGQLSGINNKNVGEGMIDFLTGRMQSFGQSRSQQTAFRENIYSAFGQDTWHVSDRLTLTYGLRYEPMTFQQDKFGRGSTFSQAAFNSNTHSTVFPNAPAGALYPGDAGVSRKLTNNRLNNFSPRLGIAYNPNPTTVFRLGGAIMYDSPALYLNQRQITNAPYTNEIGITGNIPFANPYAVYPGGVSIFPGVFPPDKTAVFPTQSAYVIMKPDARTPVIYQWTASLQQEFGRGWNFSANYLGNRNSHQYIGVYPNRASYVPGVANAAGICPGVSVTLTPGAACSTTASTNANARTPLSVANPSQGIYYTPTLTFIDDHGYSDYHGGIFTIQHRRGNFNFLGNYTWSKCLDLVDNQGDIANSQLQNSGNPRGDYAPCGFDVRHIANITFIAESKFSSLHGFAAALANGWQIAPLVRITSGTPINVTTASDVSLTAQNNDRPNLVPGQSLFSGTKVTSRAQGGNRFYFNRAAFTPAATGTFGSLPRNFLRTPNYYNVDLSVSRNFNIYERLRFQLRLESFNVLNHPNFTGFTTANPNSSTFGYATTASAPRIFQAAGRFTF